MLNAVRLRLAFLLAGLSWIPAEAFAQNRAGDNAMTQAEDAFGFSVGRESIGIYNAGNARGFSPTAAGNVRIDGLYFDPVVRTARPAGRFASASRSGCRRRAIRSRRRAASSTSRCAARPRRWAVRWSSMATAGGTCSARIGRIAADRRRRWRSASGSTAAHIVFSNGTDNRNYTASLTRPLAARGQGSRSCRSGRCTTIMTTKPGHSTFRRALHAAAADMRGMTRARMGRYPLHRPQCRSARQRRAGRRTGSPASAPSDRPVQHDMATAYLPGRSAARRHRRAHPLRRSAGA